MDNNTQTSPQPAAATEPTAPAKPQYMDVVAPPAAPIAVAPAPAPDASMDDGSVPQQPAAAMVSAPATNASQPPAAAVPAAKPKAAQQATVKGPNAPVALIAIATVVFLVLAAVAFMAFSSGSASQ